MEDGYWDLFWNTGLPEFYLLRKQESEGETEEQETRAPGTGRAEREGGGVAREPPLGKGHGLRAGGPPATLTSRIRFGA